MMSNFPLNFIQYLRSIEAMAGSYPMTEIISRKLSLTQAFGASAGGAGLMRTL
jgi:hypothetical protein